MTLGHEKLDVYRLSTSYDAWVYDKAEGLNGVHRRRSTGPIPIAISIWKDKTGGPSQSCVPLLHCSDAQPAYSRQ